MPLSPGIEPIESTGAKCSFISAILAATSSSNPFPEFGNGFKTSAREQVEYMLREDEEIQYLVIKDDEIKYKTRIKISEIFSSFQKDLSSLALASDIFAAEKKILQTLSDLEWICGILPKMGLMKDFVMNWLNTSTNALKIVNEAELCSLMWSLKAKLLELTSKVLEAVGYGNIILPAACRVQLLKTWLPYIRSMKTLLDSLSSKETEFHYQMDEDLCQNIEGAIVSLVLALPSNDQADIFADWMSPEQVKYPDLSEAFEIWCYRTKSAMRRLAESN